MLGSIYEALFRRQAPPWLHKSGPLALLWKPVRKWLCVSVVPFIPFNALRVAGYRLLGFKIGRGVFIGMQCYLDDTHPHRLVIEDKVVVSYRVTFACHGPRTRDHRLVLREGSYVGAGATLLGGLAQGDIEVGPYATVGACALVHRTVPPLATVVGVPAHVVRTTRQPWEADAGIAAELQSRLLSAPPPPPTVTPGGGVFGAAVTVSLDGAGDEAVRIHYTTDGTEPTEDSRLYGRPISVERSLTLRARAFKGGHQPSAEAVVSFEIGGRT